MTAQLNLFTSPDAALVHGALTAEWQSLERIERRTGITGSAWPHATRLVREHVAQHRASNGRDYYRIADGRAGR